MGRLRVAFFSLEIAMSKTIEVTKDFKFAHRGCDVVDYKAGDVIDDPAADLYDVATNNKWAKEFRAKTAAPRNKDAGTAPENKSD